LAPLAFPSAVHLLDFSFTSPQLSPAYDVITSLTVCAADVLELSVPFTVRSVPVALIVKVYSPTAIVSVPSEAAVLNAVTKFSRLLTSAAFLDFSTYFVYCGARIPTKIARIATTITSSTNVKPLLSFFFLLNNFNLLC